MKNKSGSENTVYLILRARVPGFSIAVEKYPEKGFKPTATPLSFFYLYLFPFFSDDLLRDVCGWIKTGISND